MLITPPGFLVGEMAWLSDGRSGLIVGGNFNADAGEWLWAVDPLGGPFRESELFHFDPTEVTEGVSERIEFDSTAFVTQDQLFQAISNLEDRITAARGVSLDQVRAIADDARDQAVNIAILDSFGQVAELRQDLENSIVSTRQIAAIQLENLASSVTTTLAAFENRHRELEAEADAAAGVTFFGLIQLLGAFLKSPFEFVVERSREFILGELNDGLNR